MPFTEAVPFVKKSLKKKARKEQVKVACVNHGRLLA